MGSAGSKSVDMPQTISSRSSNCSSGLECPLGHGKGQENGNSKAGLELEGANAQQPPQHGKCPVQRDDSTPPGGVPIKSKEEMDKSGGGCPVKHGGRMSKYLNPHKYNVYSQRVSSEVDPSNQMPSTPNQDPAPGQTQKLDTTRVESTIPKGGTEGTWTYPSPQMFWNAITRKGKVEDTKERDMDIVVAIHNNMNENTWKQILKWEALRGSTEAAEDGQEPKLLRFLGRPDDTSVKAMAKGLFGHPEPFDRHDWVVDRGGVERRYIIDYYHDEGLAHLDQTPDLDAEGAIRSISVDVRPAPDSFAGLFDRFIRMPLYRQLGRSDFSPLPFLPQPTMKQQTGAEHDSASSSKPIEQAEGLGGAGGGEAAAGTGTMAEVRLGKGAGEEGRAILGGRGMGQEPLQWRGRELRGVVEQMEGACSESLLALRSCKDEKECNMEAMRLTYCLAAVACPEETKTFDQLQTATAEANGREGVDESSVETAFGGMQACLQRLEDMAREDMREKH